VSGLEVLTAEGEIVIGYGSADNEARLLIYLVRLPAGHMILFIVFDFIWKVDVVTYLLPDLDIRARDPLQQRTSILSGHQSTLQDCKSALNQRMYRIKFRSRAS